MIRTATGGAVGAMAMSAIRLVTRQLGWLYHVPPEAASSQKAGGLLKQLPKNRRPVAIELFHWGFGAAAGALFGVLPARVLERRWVGPVYGMGMWLTFELVVVPSLGLRFTMKKPVIERLALLADHALYGLVLAQASVTPTARARHAVERDRPGSDEQRA